ncbi:MAG: response regulator transcription factor [Deltaproteobacteria bacterium]|nr:response regulator transcription factor [Deltaproteobacteria bacterium]
MAQETILLVEDEDDLVELMEYNLTREGFRVEKAGNGEKALEKARAFPPDLILLDLMLPGMDGLEVCRRLRADPATRGVPIVMVTAKGEEADVVAGLEVGADDYIPKPFSHRVLTARVRAVLRRKDTPMPEESEPLEVAGIRIHPGRREVTVAGRPVELTQTEFDVLHLLARRPGWVFSRGKIVDGIRGQGYPVTDRSVDVQIVGLRRKLEAAGDLIETVRGVGYRFHDQREETP